ncbi:MAG: 5-deoxy-glucuronate isomerase [Spirochaetes bacterium]|nr:5-deoxy-glucuronate isomerase [Spirochaetota bacterium]
MCAVKIRNKSGFRAGFNEIVTQKGSYNEYLMDFAMLKLEQDQFYENQLGQERAFLLIYGKVQFEWNEQNQEVNRPNFYDYDPYCLHTPAGVKVKITGLSADAEIAVHQTENEKTFAARLLTPDDIRIEIRGKGTMQGTGERLVRTIIDHGMNPQANLMLGEDMHYPGRWAGFPSHYHPQPEIYYYKFYPQQGFGLMKLGNEGVLMEQNDTVLIPPNQDHPQVAAPGYGMYFLWVIRHLEGNPYLQPIFVDEHLWTEQTDADIWMPKDDKK